MLSNGGDLVGDEVPRIHAHLHNNAIDESGPVKSDIKSVGGGNEVQEGKNASRLS